MKSVYLFLGLFLVGYKPATAQYSSCTTVDYIQASNLIGGGNTDAFGSKGMAISADGKTLAVGNTYDKSTGKGVNPAATGSATAAGAVFVYTRTDSVSPWVYQAYIKAINPHLSAQFGISVALSADGNTLAVGAHVEEGNGNVVINNATISTTINSGVPGSGAVYVYTRSAASTWSLTTYIKANNAGSGDNFGYSVSLSGDGNTLAVGAWNEAGSGTLINPGSNNNASNAGAVYIYTRAANGNWRFRDYIKASNTETSDNFGSFVTLSSDGNTLAVAAYIEGGSGTGVNPPDNNGAAYSGAVYTYQRMYYTPTDTVWRFRAYIKSSHSTQYTYWGNSLSLSSDGTTLAVGGSYLDGSAGSVDIYTYTPNDSTWHSSTYLQASNKDGSDAFGGSVSLSGDGNTLAVGASGESGSGTSINPTDNNSSGGSGAAYIFKRSSGTWAQHAYIKAPINVAGDAFGTRLSLSANGANLVVSAPNDKSSGTGVNPAKNNSGTKYGAVWVYNQYGAAIPRVTFDGIVSQAKVCATPVYIYLKDTSDISGHKIIARIFPNGNSFTVDSAFVDASNTGTYLVSGVGQTTKLMRRMLSINTTPATGLTVNGGPIVRFYYDVTEKATEIPAGTYPTQVWFSRSGNKDSILANLVYNNINNGFNLVPTSGTEGSVAYVDLKVTSFGTFGALGSTGGVLLPVHLLQFEAKANANCGVDISWTTANEQNIHRYVVQGSSNGSNWEDKGVVKPGTSAQQQYQYQDGLGQTGTYYYRLMYEENDGKKMYSSVVALRLNCAANSPKVFPTITQDRVNIWLPESYADAQIMVFNLVGQRQNIEQTSNGSYRVLQLNALAQGSYIVRIVQKDGNAVHLKVIKQ